MGRLHAKLSGSSLDASIQEDVQSAVRSLQRALQRARSARLRGMQGTRPVERDLNRALSALQDVRSAVPMWDQDDPDLSPSALDAWRKRREELRLLREQQAQQAVPEPEPEPEPELEVNDE